MFHPAFILVNVDPPASVSLHGSETICVHPVGLCIRKRAKSRLARSLDSSSGGAPLCWDKPTPEEPDCVDQGRPNHGSWVSRNGQDPRRKRDHRFERSDRSARIDRRSYPCLRQRTRLRSADPARLLPVPYVDRARQCSEGSNGGIYHASRSEDPRCDVQRRRSA